MRGQKDWSHGKLATKSGVSREMIGKYERGGLASLVLYSIHSCRITSENYCRIQSRLSFSKTQVAHLRRNTRASEKSGGARVITNIAVGETTVYLLSIYDKADKENLTNLEFPHFFADRRVRCALVGD